MRSTATAFACPSPSFWQGSSPPVDASTSIGHSPSWRKVILKETDFASSVQTHTSCVNAVLGEWHLLGRRRTVTCEKFCKILEEKKGIWKTLCYIVFWSNRAFIISQVKTVKGRSEKLSEDQRNENNWFLLKLLPSPQTSKSCHYQIIVFTTDRLNPPVWSLQIPFPKRILFVSPGFRELLRWPLKY